MIKRKIDAMHEAYGPSPNLCKDCSHFRRYMLPSRRTCLKCRAWQRQLTENGISAAQRVAAALTDK